MLLLIPYSCIGKHFYIFDFCGNFEFFRMNKGKATPNMIALQGAIFHLKAQITFKLQDLAYQTPELIAFRKSLVDDMVRKVRELNKENFAVRQHLKYVELQKKSFGHTALSLRYRAGKSAGSIPCC